MFIFFQRHLVQEEAQLREKQPNFLVLLNSIFSLRVLSGVRDSGYSLVIAVHAKRCWGRPGSSKGSNSRPPRGAHGSNISRVQRILIKTDVKDSRLRNLESH